MNVLEADSVMLNFGHRQILSDVYLKCCTGEIIGLLGRNGSGKSTLMKIIFGILDTDNKHIKINGKVRPYPYKNKDLIAYLPQYAFFPKEISLARIIRLWIDDKEKQNKILQDEIVKDNLNKSISELSSGERRYFEVLLLANLPSMFMLLDEPFSAIAPLFKEKIKGLINSYKQEKGIIVTDHDYKNIIEISDRTILIDHGICRQIEELSDLEKYNYLPTGTLNNENTDPVNPLEILVSDQFVADEQTFKDLELPTMDKEGEIFRIFNYTQTKGGTAALEKMLKSPSNNVDIIAKRRDSIRFIQFGGFKLEPNRKQLDFIEYYLSTNVALLSEITVDALVRFFRNKYSFSNDYYIIETGIQHTYEFLLFVTQLIQEFSKHQLPPYLSTLLFNIEDILLKKGVRDIVDDYENTKAIFRAGRFDRIIRKEVKNEIIELLNRVYELDAYGSVAEAANKFNLCYPEISASADPEIVIEGLFHPLLDNPVTNDFNMTNTKNLCFLTGANMSGKSTFLKSFGLAVYLAHVGFPVPARKMKMTVFNGLLTTINLSDNINKGYSHFYSEVKRVKEAAQEIGRKRMIVIFDELFRGTNVRDATDASLMIISALANIKGSFFLISTHIVEIAEKISGFKNVSFNCFDVRFLNDHPVYDYQLTDGVSKDSLGLYIVKQERIEEILKEAAKNSRGK